MHHAITTVPTLCLFCVYTILRSLIWLTCKEPEIGLKFAVKKCVNR